MRGSDWNHAFYRHGLLRQFYSPGGLGCTFNDFWHRRHHFGIRLRCDLCDVAECMPRLGLVTSISVSTMAGGIVLKVFVVGALTTLLTQSADYF